MSRTSPLHVGLITLLTVVLGSQFSLSQDAYVKNEKGRAKDIAKMVAADIQKNFYDANLRGVDWSGLLQETLARIDKAQSVGEIYTSIYSMVSQLGDSHTRFFPPPRTGALPLFGFEARPYAEAVLVTKLKKGGAAEAAGIELGDRIVAINQFGAERNSFDTMMNYYRFLQPANQLQIIVERGGQPKTLILRPKMTANENVVQQGGVGNANSWDLDHEWPEEHFFHEADADGIAYLGPANFEHDPDWMIGFAEHVGKPKAIIIDLRGNPGGRVDSLAAFVSHFVTEPGEIAQEVTRKKTEPTRAKPHRSSIAVPMAILVDSKSYSASEAFAKYFQLNRKATIVGDHTRGFLTAAQFFVEKYGSTRVVPFWIQIAVGKVVFPGNEIVEGIGITPDQLCLPTPQDLREEHDPCYAMAHNVLRKALGLPEYAPADLKKPALKLIRFG